MAVRAITPACSLGRLGVRVEGKSKIVHLHQPTKAQPCITHQTEPKSDLVTLVKVFDPASALI